MELDISKKREFSEFQKRARVKRCVHPNQEECSKEIIRAHSIQNNKIFSKIAEEGNVMNIVHDNSLFNEDLEAVGKGKANTFLGFCQKHDTSLFSEIENNKNYIPGNQEQEFLFAYRALAKELIAKEYAKNLYTLLIKEKASFGLLKILEGTELGLNDLKELKPDLDRALLKKEFEIIETEVIVWDKEYLFAVSSMFDIVLDFKNNQINDLLDIKKKPKPIFLTIFPQNGKTYILISYLKEHKQDFNFLEEQLLNLSEKQQKKRISWLIALYCENFAVSPKIWKMFKSSEKKDFLWIFHNTKQHTIGLEGKEKIPFNLFF